MARKKKKNKKNYKIILKRVITCSLFGILVISLSYIIFITNLLKPHINELTTSYISFNNRNTTDILRINNIRKMSDSIGKSSLNNAKLNIKIDGEKNKDYSIVLYKINCSIEDKYIKVLIDNKIFRLSDLEDSSDYGKILYIGNNSKEKNIRMWVDEKYKEKVKDTSFELKIKTR